MSSFRRVTVCAADGIADRGRRGGVRQLHWPLRWVLPHSDAGQRGGGGALPARACGGGGSGLCGDGDGGRAGLRAAVPALHQQLAVAARAGGGADRPRRRSSAWWQADQRVDHRREQLRQAGGALGGCRPAMVRPPGQGRQLPGRGVRGADRRPAARAGRHAALSATALDQRPEALRPGRDPGVRAAVALKAELALEIVRAARARGMRFAWVGVDGGYGKEPALLRALDDAGEVFVADVHSTQMVWTEPPGLHVPTPKSPRGRHPTRQRAAAEPISVERLVTGSAPRTGPAACCATAPVVPCRSTSRTGGSGCGTARKPRLAAGISLSAARSARRRRENTACLTPRPTPRPCNSRACRDSATGSSVSSRTPKASVVSPTIRCRAGSPGTTTSPW